MGMWAKFPFTWLPELLNTKKTTTKKPIDKEGPICFSVPEINITWFYYAMLDETICLCKYIFSSGHLLPQLFKETNYFRISSSTLWHMLFFHWNNSLCWERQSWVGKRKKWKNLRIVSFSLNVLYLTKYILHCGIKFVHTAVLQAHKWLFEFCSDVLCKNHSRLMNANVTRIFVIQFKWEPKRQGLHLFLSKFGHVLGGCYNLRVLMHWPLIIHTERCEGGCISLSELLVYLFLKA